MNNHNQRNNNRNDNNSSATGHDNRQQKNRAYMDESMSFSHARPLSASSVQLEGDNALVERRATFNDIRREKITEGDDSRPRPLSASSLVSSNSLEKGGDSLVSLASGSTVSHDSDLNWLLSVSVNSSTVDGPIGNRSSNKASSQVGTDDSRYSTSPLNMQEAKSSNAGTTREMRLAQRNQQMRLNSELNSADRVEYTRSYSASHNQQQQTSPLKAYENSMVIDMGDAKISSGPIHNGNSSTSPSYSNINNNDDLGSYHAPRNIVVRNSILYDQSRNDYDLQINPSMGSVADLSGLGGLKSNSLASTSLTNLSLTDSSIMQLVPRTLGQRLKLDGRHRSEFVYLRGAAKSRWKKEKDKLRSEQEKSRKEAPDYNTKRLMSSIVPDPLQSKPSFETSSEALMGLNGALSNNSVLTSSTSNTIGRYGVTTGTSSNRQKNSDILLQITLEEYASYQLACNVVSESAMAVHKLYKKLGENENIANESNHAHHVNFNGNSVFEYDYPEQKNKASDGKGKKKRNDRRNKKDTITVSGDPEGVELMLRRILLETLEKRLKNKPKTPMMSLSTVVTLLSSGVTSALTLSVAKESSFSNLNTKQIRILEGAISKVFPKLLLNPISLANSESNASLRSPSSSLSSPSNRFDNDVLEKLKMARVLDEHQLKALIAFKSPTLEMFAVCRLVYFFLHLYKDTGCHVWSETKLDHFSARYEDDMKGFFPSGDLLSSVHSPPKKGADVFKLKQQPSIDAKSFFSRCATPTVSRRPAPPPPEGTLAAINERRSRVFEYARQKSSTCASRGNARSHSTSVSPPASKSPLRVDTSGSVASSSISNNKSIITLPSSPFSRPPKSPVFVRSIHHLNFEGFWSVLDNHDSELFPVPFNTTFIYENFSFRLLEEVMSCYPSEFLFVISAILYDKNFMTIMTEKSDWKIHVQRGAPAAVGNVAVQRVTRSNSACGRLAVWMRRLLAEITSLHLCNGSTYLPGITQPRNVQAPLQKDVPFMEMPDVNSDDSVDERRSNGSNCNTSGSELYGLAHLLQERSLYGGFDEAAVGGVNNSGYLNDDGLEFDLERSDRELGIAVDSGRSSEAAAMAVGFNDDDSLPF